MTSKYTIESAYMGDERSRVKVTDSVKNQITEDGLEVVAGSALLPYVQVEGEIRLNDFEIAAAKELAEEACGGGVDAICNEIKTQEFMRKRLAEKEQEMYSAANVIKGRKLTLNLKDQTGRPMVIEVPEGQKYKLSKGELGIKPEDSYFKLDEAAIAITIEVLKIIGIALGVGAYAFSILITYRAFLQTGYLWQTILATAVAVFFPYSGFFIVFSWFGIKELIKNIPAKKQ
jgi:hypothetical protein